MDKIRIIHAPSANIELVKEVSIFCPDHKAYLITDQTNFIQLARNIYDAEKKMNDWIRRYENVLNGLKYWRNKALEKSENEL